MTTTTNTTTTATTTATTDTARRCGESRLEWRVRVGTATAQERADCEENRRRERAGNVVTPGGR